MVNLNYLFYKKLFSFSFIYIHKYSMFSIKKNLNSFFKIIKFLNSINFFGVFIPYFFSITNNLFFSFWMNGFISNFSIYKWYIIDVNPINFLPYVLINLTFNLNISVEIKNNQRPFISLLSPSGIYEDFFFSNNLYVKQFVCHYDTIYFFIFLFNFIKVYKLK